MGLVNCSSDANKHVDENAGEIKTPEPNMMALAGNGLETSPMPPANHAMHAGNQRSQQSLDEHRVVPLNMMAPIGSPIVMGQHNGSAAPPVRGSMGQQSHISHQSGVALPQQFFEERICEGGNCPPITHEEIAPGQFRSIANPEEVLYAHDFQGADSGDVVEHIEHHGQIEHIEHHGHVEQAEHYAVPVSGSNAPQPQPDLYVGAVQEVDQPEVEQQEPDVNADDMKDERAEEHVAEAPAAQVMVAKKGKRKGRKGKSRRGKKSDKKKGWF